MIHSNENMVAIKKEGVFAQASRNGTGLAFDLYCAGHGLDVKIRNGRNLADFAKEYWLACNPRHKNMICWDVPFAGGERYENFENAIYFADICGMAEINKKPFAMAWAYKIGYETKCLEMHFSCAWNNPDMAFCAGRRFINASVAKGYESAIMLLPVKFRHARNIAKELGFVEGGVIKNACHIDLHDRYVDGVYGHINFAEHEWYRAVRKGRGHSNDFADGGMRDGE